MPQGSYISSPCSGNVLSELSNSSAFSSPINVSAKRRIVPTNFDSIQEEKRRKASSATASEDHLLSFDLSDIYRNSLRCPLIGMRVKSTTPRLMATFKTTVRIAELIFNQWERQDGENNVEANSILFRNKRQHFSNFVVGFVMRVAPNLITLLHALQYTTRLRKIYPRARGESGCAHRLFVVSLLVSSKYICDTGLQIKPYYDTWSQLSGVFTAEELNRMEIEFVTFLKGRLFVSMEELEGLIENNFFGEGEMLGTVPKSVDWLAMISMPPTKQSILKPGQNNTNNINADDAAVP